MAVAIEGISEEEAAERSSTKVGLLVVDTTEYYGAQTLEKASSIVYSQLKYSTQRSQTACTSADISATLKQFFDRYRELRRSLGKKAVADRIRFQYITNRPLARQLSRGFEAAKANPTAALRNLDTLRRSLAASNAEFLDFLACVSMLAGETARTEQAQALESESVALQAYLDSASVAKMKELVRSKTLPEAGNNKTITRGSLLNALGFIERELFPAPPSLSSPAKLIGRKQAPGIGTQVAGASWPVVIHAAGGIGKSVLAQNLERMMPAGSVVVIFDGFAGGSYRSPSEPRHLHDRGLVQIANSLAQMGLCDILLPTPGPPDAYLRSFRRRLAQASAELRQRSSGALVVIALDAADNSVMAARARGDKAFVVDLLSEPPPDGCRIVALARTERLGHLELPAQSVSVELEPFDEDETAAHLRSRFPEATDLEIRRFRKLTDANPRVQANALSAAKSLTDLMTALGPRVTTAENLIEKQLEDALDQVRREHSGGSGDVQRLCQALAVLPPVVPLGTLAKAARLPVSAIRSFASDFAGGRPLTIIADSIQFRDEPVETWFHRHFIPNRQEFTRIVEALAPAAATDGYVASALPQLLFGAQQYQSLLRLALVERKFKSSDPVEQRQVALARVQFALKAAISYERLTDAAKLMLRAGDEAAADERQSGFLLDNGDLVADLSGSTRVFDFVFRKRAWRASGTGLIRCADMLAHDPVNRDEAGRFLRLAMQWLQDWGASSNRTHERMEDDRILSYASAICALKGPAAAADFLGRWRQRAISLRVGMLLARRLLEHSDVASAHGLLMASKKNVHLRLGVIAELHRRYVVIDKRTIAEAVRQTLRLKPKDIYDQLSQNPYPAAIASLAEAAARTGLSRPKVSKLLARFMPSHTSVLGRWDRGRDEVFRFTVLACLIKGREPILADLTPNSLKAGAKAVPGEDERQFSRIYGALLPWYRLRCRAILGRLPSAAWAKAEQTARASIGKQPDWSDPQREERGVLNEIPILWADALGFSRLATKSRLSSLRDWLLDSKATFTQTLTNLARIAAVLGQGDLAIQLVSRAKDQIMAEHAEARSRADDLANIARAVLPVSKDEAKEYFRLALEVIDRLGEDVYSRVFALARIASRVGESGKPSTELAYRLARSVELLAAHNDHKFPWHEAAEAIAALSPASGFAISARWRDREKVSTSSSLVPIVHRLLESGELRPSTAAALHIFAGWWSLRDSAHHLFDRAASKAERKLILDYLVRDLEFVPRGDLRWVESLSAEARKHALRSERLEERLRQLREFGDPTNAGPSFDSAQTAKPVDWGKVLRGCDLRTPAGVDNAVARCREQKTYWRFETLFDRMVRRVAVDGRVPFIDALAKSSLDPWNCVIALDVANTAWGTSLAVRKAVQEAARIVLRQAPLEFAQRALGDEMRARVVRLAGMPDKDVIELLVSCIGAHADHVSSSSWFHLASEVSRQCLAPVQAKDVLGFALDQLAAFLKPTDGDGPWTTALKPPADLDGAVAGYIYTALSSPYAEKRWLGAHSVRRLCKLNEGRILTRLIAYLNRSDLPAFRDARFPFYVWNARLFLFIALARAAEESPSSLRRHVRVMVEWALNREPHVLIRHFAAQAALHIERAAPGTLSTAEVQRLNAVNVSPFPPKMPPTGKKVGWQQADWKRRVFGHHIDEDWLGPLAETFNLRGSVVADRVHRWITKNWGIRHSGAWKDEPRAGFFRDGMRTYSDHGSLPDADRYSFYLGYHALQCVAGDLLKTTPTTAKTGYVDRTWPIWLSGQLLTRPDGHWVSDRRDFEPLRTRRWDRLSRKQKQDVGSHWRWSILAEDFDEEIGIDRTGLCSELTVWSSWTNSIYSQRESVSVSSALVSPRTSTALLRAAQTADCFQDYRIPPEHDNLEIREPNFELRGWVRTSDRAERGLDIHDPIANNVRWPAIRPGRLVRRLWKLTADAEERSWSFREGEVFRTVVWGSDGGHDREPAGYYGVTMKAEPRFILSALERIGKDLIIEVEFEREDQTEKRKTFDDQYYRHRLYTRLYLLKASGNLYTLHGHRRLRRAAGR